MSSSETISPTAHYTGYVWARNGLSHPSLETAQGRLLFESMRPMMMVSSALGGASLEAYLLARHRAIDRLRGTAKTRQEAQLETIERTAGMPDPWETVALDLERKQILEAFQQLPEAQRLALELAYFRGYTHTEIARHLNLPLGTVKGRLRMGLEKMRSYLQARGVTP